MYWEIGKSIVIEEQNNQGRVEYEKYVLKNLSEIYGSGFSEIV